MSKKTADSNLSSPAIPVLVAVCEDGKSNQKRAMTLVAELGYQVADEKRCDTVVERLRGANPPDVVMVAVPANADVVTAAIKMGVDRPILVASLSCPPVAAPELCEQAHCDLFVIRPHSADSIAAVLHAASVLSTDRAQVRALRGNEQRLRERLQHYGQAELSTGFQHIDFFKNFLVMELKRAKRYGYPLAACLVAIDPWDDEHPEPGPLVTRELRGRVASAIAAAMRDIDLPVDYADDRFLAFLPYTDLDGAKRVGRRIAAAVKATGIVSVEGSDYRMSVSVGIAATKPDRPISFAKLMRDASVAVRAAQLKGGGRVVVRK